MKKTLLHWTSSAASLLGVALTKTKLAMPLTKVCVVAGLHAVALASRKLNTDTHPLRNSIRGISPIGFGDSETYLIVGTNFIIASSKENADARHGKYTIWEIMPSSCTELAPSEVLKIHTVESALERLKGKKNFCLDLLMHMLEFDK